MVEIPIALGMTNAVIFFSIEMISLKGITSYCKLRLRRDTYIGNPTKDICVETNMVLRNVDSTLHKNILR